MAEARQPGQAPQDEGNEAGAPGAYCAAGPAWSVPVMFLSSS